MGESKQCPECQSWNISLYWSGVCYGTCAGCGHIWIDDEIDPEEDDGNAEGFLQSPWVGKGQGRITWGGSRDFCVASSGIVTTTSLALTDVVPAPDASGVAMKA